MPLDARDVACEIEPQWFRQVLGQYPTGVCAVTAMDDEIPVGMVVGSFTSASLNPPLVAFFADKRSTTWPRIERSGSFCVNVLGADDRQTCQQLSSKAPDKFDGVTHRSEVTGSPVLSSAVAWMDCAITEVREAGDHYLVLGRVLALELERPRLPMLFFRGGYGRFSPVSLDAPDPTGSMAEPLRVVDVIRPEIQQLSLNLQARCALAARVDDEIVVVGSADAVERPGTFATLVGLRIPLVAPMGGVLVAWDDAETARAWLAPLDPRIDRRPYLTALQGIRQRGYSVGLASEGQRDLAERLDRAATGSRSARLEELYGMAERLVPEPENLSEEDKLTIRQISAPIVRADGSVALSLTVYGFPKPVNGIDEYLSAVLRSAAAASRRIGAPEACLTLDPGQIS